MYFSGNDNDEYLIRPAIAAVRYYIRVVNQNPFVFAPNREEVLYQMEELGENVRTAAKRLSEMASVRIRGFGDESVISALANDLYTGIRKRNVLIDVGLSDAFMKSAAPPYFILQKLERHQGKTGRIIVKKAREAMIGLGALHDFTGAVPIVYSKVQTESEPTPLGAVA